MGSEKLPYFVPSNLNKTEPEYHTIKQEVNQRPKRCLNACTKTKIFGITLSVIAIIVIGACLIQLFYQTGNLYFKLNDMILRLRDEVSQQSQNDLIKVNNQLTSLKRTLGKF